MVARLSLSHLFRGQQWCIRRFHMLGFQLILVSLLAFFLFHFTWPLAMKLVRKMTECLLRCHLRGRKHTLFRTRQTLSFFHIQSPRHKINCKNSTKREMIYLFDEKKIVLTIYIKLVLAKIIKNAKCNSVINFCCVYASWRPGWEWAGQDVAEYLPLYQIHLFFQCECL